MWLIRQVFEDGREDAQGVRMRWAAATILLTCLTVRVLAQENHFLPNAAQPPSPREQIEIISAPEIPADWPVTAVPGEIDYGFVNVDGEEFLLPQHSEMRMVWKDGSQTRSVTVVSNYHKFSTGVTLTPVN
jgi:hypothetical protein